MIERETKSTQSNDFSAKKNRGLSLPEIDSSYAFSHSPDVPIYRKASCACGGGCPACQAKSDDLKISQPNDPAEIEADQIADNVMRMPLGEISQPLAPTGRMNAKANAWNHSRNSSVSISPSFGLVNSTFQMKYGRPDKSSATRDNVSSIGI